VNIKPRAISRRCNLFLCHTYISPAPSEEEFVLHQKLEKVIDSSKESAQDLDGGEYLIALAKERDAGVR
jgi:hypothetical protein